MFDVVQTMYHSTFEMILRNPLSLYVSKDRESLLFTGTLISSLNLLLTVNVSVYQDKSREATPLDDDTIKFGLELPLFAEERLYLPTHY